MKNFFIITVLLGVLFACQAMQPDTLPKPLQEYIECLRTNYTQFLSKIFHVNKKTRVEQLENFKKLIEEYNEYFKTLISEVQPLFEKDKELQFYMYELLMDYNYNIALCYMRNGCKENAYNFFANIVLKYEKLIPYALQCESIFFKTMESRYDYAQEWIDQNPLILKFDPKCMNYYTFDPSPSFEIMIIELIPYELIQSFEDLKKYDLDGNEEVVQYLLSQNNG